MSRNQSLDKTPNIQNIGGYIPLLRYETVTRLLVLQSDEEVSQLWANTVCSLMKFYGKPQQLYGPAH